MELIKALITSYFGIVRKNFTDFVPKAVMCYLVNAARDRMHKDLVQALFKESEFQTLLGESESTAQIRAELAHMMTNLVATMEVLQDVRSFTLS